MMPKMNGIDATRLLHRKYPELGIIALSMFNDDSLVIDMLEVGARGYLLKNVTKKNFFDAIETVHGGGT